MSIPEKYRGIEYSVSDRGNGKWVWKLHRKLVAGAVQPIISGAVRGGQDEAISAAKAAIDKELGAKSN